MNDVKWWNLMEIVKGVPVWLQKSALPVIAAHMGIKG